MFLKKTFDSAIEMASTEAEVASPMPVEAPSAEPAVAEAQEPQKPPKEKKPKTPREKKPKKPKEAPSHPPYFEVNLFPCFRIWVLLFLIFYDCFRF